MIDVAVIKCGDKANHSRIEAPQPAKVGRCLSQYSTRVADESVHFELISALVKSQIRCRKDADGSHHSKSQARYCEGRCLL